MGSHWDHTGITQKTMGMRYMYIHVHACTCTYPVITLYLMQIRKRLAHFKIIIVTVCMWELGISHLFSGRQYIHVKQLFCQIYTQCSHVRINTAASHTHNCITCNESTVLTRISLHVCNPFNSIVVKTVTTFLRCVLLSPNLRSTGEVTETLDRCRYNATHTELPTTLGLLLLTGRNFSGFGK